MAAGSRPSPVRRRSAEARRRAQRPPVSPKRAGGALGALVLVVAGCSGVVLGSYEQQAARAAEPAPVVPAPPTEQAAPEPVEPTPGQHVPVPGAIDDPGSIDVVVNKQRPLPADFAPQGLVSPAELPNPSREVVRSEVAAALDELNGAARAQGVDLVLTSGYRSYAEQETINRTKREQVGDQADLVSARAGFSEHQTGLAVDLAAANGACTLQACFGETAEGRWLADNAWRHGFLLRYPQDLTDVVGYAYEPWHFRFVGVETATRMHNEGIRTLEEYRGLPAAPDYR